MADRPDNTQDDTPDNTPRDGRTTGSKLPYAVDYHAPVLCKTAVDGLVTDEHGTYVDGTLGGGGHTAALLNRLATDAVVFGLDRDDDAIVFASGRLKREIDLGRLVTIRGNIADLLELMRARGIRKVDGLLLDLGVSSHQLDTPERGFSHSKEGELDMRMDRAEGPTESAPTGTSAGALINTSSERTLRDVLFRFGEEPRARRIAGAIVAARPMSTTTELAEVIRNAVPREVEAKTLARVFQAIRIEVNRELEALEAALYAATELVKPGGRLVVIAYHSLEDRIVKRFMRSGSSGGDAPRDLYGNVLSPWKVIGRVVRADEAESAANPRSRSARLRIAERSEYDPSH